jgi:hypothetical protein
MVVARMPSLRNSACIETVVWSGIWEGGGRAEGRNLVPNSKTGYYLFAGEADKLGVDGHEVVGPQTLVRAQGLEAAAGVDASVSLRHMNVLLVQGQRRVAEQQRAEAVEGQQALQLRTPRRHDEQRKAEKKSSRDSWEQALTDTGRQAVRSRRA